VRSKAEGLPPRCTCPKIVTRVSYFRRSAINYKQVLTTLEHIRCILQHMLATLQSPSNSLTFAGILSHVYGPRNNNDMNTNTSLLTDVYILIISMRAMFLSGSNILTFCCPLSQVKSLFLIQLTLVSALASDGYILKCSVPSRSTLHF